MSYVSCLEFLGPPVFPNILLPESRLSSYRSCLVGQDNKKQRIRARDIIDIIKVEVRPEVHLGFPSNGSGHVSHRTKIEQVGVMILCTPLQETGVCTVSITNPCRYMTAAISSLRSCTCRPSKTSLRSPMRTTQACQSMRLPKLLL